MLLEQVQCPNCGGYEVKPDNTAHIVKAFLTHAMTYVFYGFIVALRQEQRDRKKFLDGENTATCTLCKYRFLIDQVPRTPIVPKEELIRAGRVRIREELRDTWD